MIDDKLLPPNSTKLERAVVGICQRFDPPQHIKTLWDPYNCPESILPYLAWALSVDEWDPKWSVEKKRTVIAAARAVHEKKGTTGAVRRALASLGHPDAEIINRVHCVRRDGTAKRDQWRIRKGYAGWATFLVILKRPATIAQAELIRRTLDAVKRNCVRLVGIDFSAAAISRNGEAKRAGSYTRGLINL